MKKPWAIVSGGRFSPLADIEKCAETIRSILGEEYPTDLFRFPYGSTNKACRDYRQAVREAGYRYFDWNALNGDAETGTYKRTPEELLEQGIRPNTIRLSIGTEHIDDLLTDLQRGFDALKG